MYIYLKINEDTAEWESVHEALVQSQNYKKKNNLQSTVFGRLGLY